MSNIPTGQQKAAPAADATGQAAQPATSGFLGGLQKAMTDPKLMNDLLEQLANTTPPPDIGATKAFGQKMTSQALPQPGGMGGGPVDMANITKQVSGMLGGAGQVGGGQQNPLAGVTPAQWAGARPPTQAPELQNYLSQLIQPALQGQQGVGMPVPFAPPQFDFNRLIQGG